MDRFCVDLSACVGVVSAAKKYNSETGVLPELEIRLGFYHRDQHRFEPRMSVEQVHNLEARMDTFRDWNTVCDVWKLINTYYHKSSIAHDKRQLRSDLVFNSEVETVKTTMEKVKLCDRTFVVDGSTVETPVDFRVALSVEKPISDRDIPNKAVPHRCVVKLRKEYTYSPSNYAEPVLAFHLTKRWSGVAYAETMASVNTPPECDIEIELLSERYLQECSAEEIAFKMLWKVYSIIVELRRGDPSKDVVVAHTTGSS